MSRLSPEGEQLVRAGRAVLRPSDADRERVFQGLLQQAGNLPNAGAGTTEPSRAPAASRLTLPKGAGVLVGLAVAGAGAFFALRPGPAADAVPAVPPPAAIVQSAEATLPAVPAVPAPPSNVAELPSQLAPPVLSVEELAREVPPRAASKRPSRTRSDDQLAREVALLSRASSELHAGRPAIALEALEEHARRFPSGALLQERAAGRARALCALGRTKEAEVELAKLPPGSPHAARAAKACSAPPERR